MMNIRAAPAMSSRAASRGEASPEIQKTNALEPQNSRGKKKHHVIPIITPFSCVGEEMEKLVCGRRPANVESARGFSVVVVGVSPSCPRARPPRFSRGKLFFGSVAPLRRLGVFCASACRWFVIARHTSSPLNARAVVCVYLVIRACVSHHSFPSCTVSTLAPGTRVTMRAQAVAGRKAGSMQVVAKVKDAGAPSRYEALFLMKPGVEDSVRAEEVDKLRSMFEAGGATEFEVTDRGLCQNAYEIKGFADSHQYMLNIQCPRGTVKVVQDTLAMPVIGAEEIILRYMFFTQK